MKRTVSLQFRFGSVVVWGDSCERGDDCFWIRHGGEYIARIPNGVELQVFDVMTVDYRTGGQGVTYFIHEVRK